MIEPLLASYALTLGLVDRAVADLTPAQAYAQPPGLPNHAAWTLGHLAVSAQAIGGELGLAPWLPPAWDGHFGTGSVPGPDAGRQPPLAELRTTLADAHRRVAQRVRTLGSEGLAGPLPDARHRATFPSLGHAVLHVLSGHTAFHAGQLMAWRRAMGLPTEPAL